MTLFPASTMTPPSVVIQPSKSLLSLDLRALWPYQELLYFLVWREVKVRYKQTVLGIAWAMLQPLLTMVIFTVIFGTFVNIPSDGLPYPIFAYTALLVWTFISNAVLSSSYSIVTNAQIITRVYFSRLLIPAATVGVRLVDLIIASLVLVALMIYYHVPLSWNILLLPLFVIQAGALALALGIWGATLNVRYRDVGTVLPILLQVWMFISPIVYSSSIVPAKSRLLYSMNPLAGIIGGFRASLFNLPFDWSSIIISALITLPLLAFSIHVFRRMEASFADEV